MPSTFVTIFVSFAIASSTIIYKTWLTRRSPLPPGPPRKWLVGNMFDFPTSRPWLTFRDWCNEHGGLVFIDLPFKPIVVIGSVQVARDLLDDRSRIYSDRPYSTMMEILDWSWAFFTMPYNSEWRANRKYFHDHFRRSAIPSYHSILLQETHVALKRLLEAPNESHQHLRNFPGSSIMRVVYGVRSAAQLREYVDLAEHAVDSIRRTLIPGAFLAELISFLKYIPPWMPGGMARAFAAQYRPVVQQLRDRPFDEVKQAMAEGKATPSIVYSLIKDMQGEGGYMTKEQVQIARGIAATAYAAASDTACTFQVYYHKAGDYSHMHWQTTATLLFFVLAMAMYPEAQRKAQEELERVVGPSRLPDFNDTKSLVYVHALMLETLRWRPIAPTGAPHALSEDDVYKGYHIPKGSLIIANSWAMLHDPVDYPEPDTFNPERFMTKDGEIDTSVRDPTTIAFGFGRRACAGKEFSLSSLKIFMASMLHVYDIQPGVGEDGHPVVLSAEGSDEAIMYALFDISASVFVISDAGSGQLSYDISSIHQASFESSGASHPRHRAYGGLSE
ncbi:cytochrome P450 [Cristinia sonorae]|uniref:Cytochrome P450 n=1 Tax=Cristinia sonorae TaxID=1940300 RepID=A0A8K0XTC9_9AGAR|nr:cytochrome P450 [Cristinia sonorae]